MRGDRRRSQSQPLSRKDAADASARTLYHVVPTGNQRRLTCTQARRLLAAYRRDDWSPAELELFGAHVTSCAECRRAEAAFRSVGESVRQLPSIAPSDALRERVFAAIRDDQASETPALVRLTSDETQPKLPAVRGRAGAPHRPIVLGRPAAIAVAAALLIGLVGARLIPAIAHDLPSVAASLANIAPNNVLRAGAPTIVHYNAPAGSGPIVTVLASSQWVVFATGKPGTMRLYATNRASHHTIAVVSGTQAGSVSLRGLSDHWVIWLAGDGTAGAPWTLWASPLPAKDGAAAGQPVALADSSAAGADTPALFDGAWIAGDTALVALVTHGGEARIVRFDLALGQTSAGSRVIAQGATGHVLSDPALDAGQYYWADAWVDGNDALHSDVWRTNDTGQAQAITTNGNAFAPRLAGQSLVTIQPSGPVLLDPPALAAQPEQAIQSMLRQVDGAVYAQALSAGKAQRVGTHALARSLVASQSLIVWFDGAQVHTFDVTHHALSVVDTAIRDAAFASATSTTLAWGQAGAASVSVFDQR